MIRARGDIGIILLSAGKGVRFGRAVPKQYLTFRRKPVFVYALQPFLEILGGRIASVVIAVDSAMKKQVSLHLHRHIGGDPSSFTVVNGGEKRIESLLKAAATLREIHPEIKTVFIHDAARPLLQAADIQGLLRSFEKNRWDAGVISKPVSESLFLFEKDVALVRGINRERYCLGDTPFIISLPALSELCQKWHGKLHTLHNSVDILELIALYKNKFRVGHYHGQHLNIKLTHPHDWLVIKDHLRKRYANR
jgi:2-C-methyl-D-erythritol 4-phosphate cytidylyltransferase